MLSREDFEKLINSIKEKMDENTGALISEDLLEIISNYSMALDNIEEVNSSIEKLKSDNEELLKVNGRLFQKIGFDKEEDDVKEVETDEVEVIDVEDVIDEKGDLI